MADTAYENEKRDAQGDGRDEGLGEDERGTGRLEAFSDGVIAIAITLLVLNIQLPQGPQGQRLVEALLSQRLTFLGYVTSFLIVGIYWANHHNIFRYIQRTTHVFLLLNLFFLMVIAFMPFATAVYTRYIEDAGQKHSAALFYGGTLLLTALLFNALWWYAAGRYRLIDRRLDRGVVRQITQSYLVGPLLYLLATLLSLLSVEVSLALYIAIPLLYVLPLDRFRRRKRNASAARRDLRAAGDVYATHTRE